MNNDLISRSALKKAFEDTVCIEPMPYAFVKQIIDNAPTADDWHKFSDELWKNAYKEGYKQAIIDRKTNFSRPTGEWKVYGRQGEIPITDYCTNCKYEMRWYKNKYNFCPNCGADMRGEKE